MNKNDIIRMADEAWLSPVAHIPNILEFATLVAAAEREACIDIVARHGGSVEIEAAIRARGQG